MAEEILNVDNCVDVTSIRAKIEELKGLTEYANDLSPRAYVLISELKERLSKLEDGD